MTLTFRTYRSFFVSCFVHAIMLFMLLYARRRAYSQDTHEELFPRSATPAKVQMQTVPFTPPQPVSTSASSTPVDKPEPYPSDDVQTDESVQSITDSTEQSTQGTPHEDPLRGTIRSNPVSKDTFMKAFSSAIQQGRRPVQSSKTHEGYQGPQHVQERLQEWTEHHYKDRIIKALRNASITTSSKMRFDRSLKKMVTIRIPILKDGTIGRLTANDLTGISEVDTHLMKVLRVTDFPPIPDHYGSDTYVFPLSFMVYLQEGSELYHLYV